MGRFALWLFRFTIGAVMFGAGIGPKDAKSNVSEWLDLFGFDQAALATQDYIVDDGLLWACFFLIVVSFVPNFIEAAGRSGLRVPKRRIDPYSLYRSINRYENLFSTQMAKSKGQRNIGQLNLESDATLTTMKKAGIAIPTKFTDSHDQAITTSLFLQQIAKLLENGHIREAKAKSKALAKDGVFQWDNATK